MDFRESSKFLARIVSFALTDSWIKDQNLVFRFTFGCNFKNYNETLMQEIKQFRHKHDCEYESKTI